ncbi:MAG: hypothetical protein WAW86_04780 [Gammaproteobacteria bacterium]
MLSSQNTFLEWIISEDTAISTTKQAAIAQFESSYPKEERWRMLVDGYLYAPTSNNPDPNGWMGYESREYNSIGAYFLAWQFCLKRLKLTTSREPLTIDFILKLHFLVTDDVSHHVQGESGKFRLGSDNETFALGLEAHCITEAGAIDLAKSLKENKARVLYMAEEGSSSSIQTLTEGVFLRVVQREGTDPEVLSIRRYNMRLTDTKTLLSNEDMQSNGYFLVSRTPNSGYHIDKMIDSVDTTNIDQIIYSKMQQQGILYIASKSSDQELSDLVADTLMQYNNKITSLQCDQDKLILIGKTIERLERIHPFKDANGRVFVNLLLNYLLLEEGFPPATLFEPNVFDAYGYHAKVLTKGILNTQAIYAGEKALFGLTMTPPQIDGMRRITERALIRDLSNYLANFESRASSSNDTSTPILNIDELLDMLNQAHLDACLHHPHHQDLVKIKSALPLVKQIFQQHTATSVEQYEMITQLFDRFTLTNYPLTINSSTLFGQEPPKKPADSTPKKRCNQSWWGCNLL